MRAQYPATLTVPRGGELAGLTVLPESADATDSLEREISRQVTASDVAAFVLRDPAAPDGRVLVAVATGFILTPARDLTRAMRDLTKGSRVGDLPPGPLGGHLRCGGLTDEDGELVVVCAWIDHGSIGIGLFGGGRPMDECAAKLSEIREAVLTRG